MSDILFSHSYFLAFDPKEYRAMMPYPPLGTLYAASVARRAGYTVALFDAMLARTTDEIRKHIERHAPKVVVVYDDDFNYLTKMCLTRMREAAFTMSEIAKQQGCTVIIHGSDAVDHIEKYIAHGADFILCGEGEKTLIECLDFLLRGRGAKEEILGLAYMRAGAPHRNAERPVQKDLDALPFPAWDLIDVERYRRLWRKHHGYFSANIVTTRGCPFHCNWCAKPIYGQVYNSRSPQNVVEEMRWMKQTIQPDHLWFCDDIFGLKPGWVEQFSDEVVKRDARIPFKCLSRVDLLLKENAIQHLKRAGCQTIWVGAESGSQRILDAMEKGTTIEQIYEATRRMQHAGIRVGFFLQYGYPGETRDDIELTLKMVRECMPDEIGVSVSYPLPGTKFYENVKAQMSQKQNWTDSEDLAMMFAGTYSPEFYRALHKLTHKQFRIAQSKLFMKQWLQQPGRIPRGTMRRLAAGAYHVLTLPTTESRLAALSHSPRPV